MLAEDFLPTARACNLRLRRDVARYVSTFDCVPALNLSSNFTEVSTLRGYEHVPTFAP
jgi:hypothetical protein